jgi:hypothetical protein
LVDLLYKAKKIKNFETVLAAVMERERVMSTAMGDWSGDSTCKTDAVDGLAAAFGITRNLVDFDSIDGKPVHIVFFVNRPDRTERSAFESVEQNIQIDASRGIPPAACWRQRWPRKCWISSRPKNANIFLSVRLSTESSVKPSKKIRKPFYCSIDLQSEEAFVSN